MKPFAVHSWRLGGITGTPIKYKHPPFHVNGCLTLSKRLDTSAPVSWPLLLQGLCLLLQHRQPHSDVKPIDQMLAKGMQILLHPTDILTAIRHEYHLLILLHPLRLHQLPQSSSRSLVVGLNEPETLRRRYFALIVPPKSDDAFARDHFEPSLLVRRPNVTAVDTNRDRTIW